MTSAVRKTKVTGCKRVPFSSSDILGKNSSEIQIYHQISLPIKGTILHIAPPPGEKNASTKRAAFCSLSKASLTVEAAIALPLFFMTVVCLISIMNVYGLVLDKAAGLRDIAEVSAAAADVSSDELYIDMNVPVVFTPYCLPDGIASVTIPCSAYVRAWNGRDEASTLQGKTGSYGTYVYVTENGTVYHTSADCTHISLSVKPVFGSETESLRNKYGEKYHSCEKCAKNGAGVIVYITDSGDCYHNSSECSGLKRTVKLVDINELDGMGKCSRCAANG